MDTYHFLHTVSFSNYLHIYIFTYLHIYIFTYLHIKCTKRGSNPRIFTITGLKSVALDHSAIRAYHLWCASSIFKLE